MTTPLFEQKDNIYVEIQPILQFPIFASKTIRIDSTDKQTALAPLPQRLFCCHRNVHSIKVQIQWNSI